MQSQSQSPSKRKRSHSSLPSIDTVPVLLPRERHHVDGDGDSPGTLVADDLQRLAMSDSDTHHVMKKRITDTPIQSQSCSNVIEIQETPGAYDTFPRRALSPPASSPSALNLAQQQQQQQHQQQQQQQQHRFKLHPPSRVTSPPPPTPVASPLVELDQPPALSTAVSIAQDKLSALRCDSPSTLDLPPAPPCPQTGPSTPDKSLTWQDSEITGHEIDAGADDDGEGINGIGFIPTPAIANKRQEWRRRQITDWRARETKEARQRRYEKRKASQCDSHPSCSAKDLKRRAVRFAEA